MDAQDQNRKNAWKAQEKKKARDAFPLPDESLAELFAHVADVVEREGCDHTLKTTEAWILRVRCEREPLITWLQEHGGYCDCEVVANVCDHWEQNR